MAKRIRRSASKFTQVATTLNVYAYTVDLQSSCVDLPLGCQTAKNLRRLAYEFEIDQSQRKASQVNASRKRTLNCVELRVPLARALVLLTVQMTQTSQFNIHNLATDVSWLTDQISQSTSPDKFNKSLEFSTILLLQWNLLKRPPNQNPD